MLTLQKPGSRGRGRAAGAPVVCGRRPGVSPPGCGPAASGALVAAPVHPPCSSSLVVLKARFLLERKVRFSQASAALPHTRAASLAPCWGCRRKGGPAPPERCPALLGPGGRSDGEGWGGARARGCCVDRGSCGLAPGRGVRSLRCGAGSLCLPSLQTPSGPHYPS